MASQETGYKFNVTSGPSKFDLMLSLFDGNKHPRRTVEFSLEGTKKALQVGINGVEQEDGSGESWNFKGVSWGHPGTQVNVKGYFSTKTRSGYVTLEAPYTMVHDPINGGWFRKENQMELTKLHIFVLELKK